MTKQTQRSLLGRKDEAVPQPMREKFDAVMEIVDPLCRGSLNDEYAALCREMAVALSRKRPSPLARGTARVWAGAIVYAVGRVNCLFDKGQSPHLSAVELCRLMGVSQASASAKAGQISDLLGLMPLDPRWCLPSKLGDNPLAWMITVDGLVMDARQAPREVQEEAFQLGLIPLLPESGVEARRNDERLERREDGMLKMFDSEVRKYKSIRAMGMPLMTGVGKTVPRDLILQAAKDFRMLGKDGRTVVMDAEDEVDFLMDRAIHDIPWPKERWIERVCAQSLADYAPREQEMLRAQSEAYFSLYEIATVEAGRGLRLRDVFNGREIRLIDLGLGATAEKGGLLATRVVALDGLHFTSGVGTPFPAEERSKLVGNFTALFEKRKDTMTWELMMRRYAPYFFLEYREGNQDIRLLASRHSE